ncbi:hypothetical protein B0H14DRAFT_276842 [Mycena olivaceomarginata]|nr:hypothetical protein B0H14DRAFT_276842 [Mycena olivaceomarginata]
MHLERAASRSFTTAESSTRNGDVEDDDEFELGSAGEGDNAQSPPTSFEAGHADEEAGSGAETAARDEEDEDEDEDGGEDHYHETPAPHPWYKPALPVLLTLAPPIGNWLTGGDHVKDLLLLLLLVFYLHQIVEVPDPSTTPPAPHDTDPDPAHIPALRARRAARAQSSLRTLELGLLLLCLITPFLGVALLRSLASLSSPSSSWSAAPVPISWFSTALFGLATRPPPAARARLAHRLAHKHAALSSPCAPFVPRQERRHGIDADAARRAPRAGSRASSSRWRSWPRPTGRTRCTRTPRTRSRRSRRA